MEENEFPKIDRNAISVMTFAQADKEDREFWLSKTPQERLRHLELLRRINYGSAATARMEKVLEIVEQE